MDMDEAPHDEDLIALDMRRDRLRAFAGRVAEAIEAIDMPTSFIDAERAARCVAVADRMIVRSSDEAAPATTKAARKRLRVFADRLLDALEAIPMPKCHLEGERAARCGLATDRMMVQLYQAPKLAKSPKSPREYADESEATCAPIHFRDEDPNDWDSSMRRIDRQTRAYAQGCRFWPDGTPFDANIRFDYTDFDATLDLEPDIAYEIPDPLGAREAARLIIGRANAITRSYARHHRRWPDMTPYTENDPDYYVISSAFEGRVMERNPDAPAEPGEIPGPSGYPWWMVRKPRG